VAIDTDQYPRNAYSATPEEVQTWLENARKAYQMLGVEEGRHPISEKEEADLRQFQRGVFVKRDLGPGHTINSKDLFYAWPCEDGQMVANDLSKYKIIQTLHPITKNGPILFENVDIVDNRKKVYEIVQSVKALINKADVVYPGGAELEISHHYGIDNFFETGITMITVVNREYCKKLIAMLPNQNHPEQYHRKKEETFHVLYGDLQLYLNGEHQELIVGNAITIQPEVRHSFKTKSGCVLEEISSKHYKDDSYYTDENIGRNENRKTLLKYWL
jgi:quercetin dioxygenase-like cupin family protein